MIRTKILVTVLCLFVSALTLAAPQTQRNEVGDSTGAIDDPLKRQYALQQPGVLDEQVASVREKLLAQPSIFPEQSQMAAPPVDNLTVWKRQKEIADKASASDYFGAMVREDGFIAWGIQHLRGDQMFNPDESWRPFEEQTWKGLAEGIPEGLLTEFRKSIQESTNAQQAGYLKGLMFEKMRDRELLGTMGAFGNTVRFLLAVAPFGLAIGALFFLGFLHHKFKVRADRYYAHQVEQETQKVALERKQKEFSNRMR